MSDNPEQTSGAGSPSGNDPAPEHLDLTKEGTGSAPGLDFLDLTKDTGASAPQIAIKPLPPKERWQGPLAFLLIGATVAVPLLALAAVVFGTDVKDVADITQVIFPPLVGLLGAVIGFYFGERSN